MQVGVLSGTTDDVRTLLSEGSVQRASVGPVQRARQRLLLNRAAREDPWVGAARIAFTLTLTCTLPSPLPKCDGQGARCVDA